ncbi:hypothetical protein ACOXXX_00805 [Thalassococcus sp. BH17M4-6]|uniref:hypothetical protein n=1 Tax=Thalassococcus sp. BH17M4-6 TaxID=3413148 RepID=UPI003BE41AE7
MQTNSFEAVSKTLSAIERKEAYNCLRGETRAALTAALDRMQTACRAGDSTALADAVEDGMLCLVRGMGHDISARDAEDLIDGVFPQVMCLTGGEGRAYEVALPFVERLFTLRDLSGASPDDRFEPDPTLFKDTLAALQARIEGLCLDQTDRAALLAPLHDLERLSKKDIGKHQNAIEDAMAAYFQRVAAFESIAYTPTTANYLRGRILFSGPAVVCLFGWSWPAQILAGLVIVLVGGITYVFQSTQSKRAFKASKKAIDDLSKTGKQLDKAIDAEAKPLDVEEIDEVIANLTKRRAGLRKDPTIRDKKQRIRIRKRLDRAIKRLKKNKRAKEAADD